MKKASTACFVIVSKKDIPIYEAEVGTAPRVLATSSFWFFESLSFWFDYCYLAEVESPESDFLYLVILNFLIPYDTEERRSSLPALVNFACCSRHCSGPCLDYQCHVSSFFPFFRGHFLRPFFLVWGISLSSYCGKVSVKSWK